jgi:hypothetical protein
VDFFCLATNVGASVTATLYTGTTGTNGWSALSNYALATQSVINYTNAFASTVVATNTYNLAGTTTNYAAGTSTFIGPTLIPAPFTNSGAVTLTSGQITTIGFNIADQNRYMICVITPSSGTTNAITSAVLTARRNQ